MRRRATAIFLKGILGDLHDFLLRVRDRDIVTNGSRVQPQQIRRAGEFDTNYETERATLRQKNLAANVQHEIAAGRPTTAKARSLYYLQ